MESFLVNKQNQKRKKRKTRKNLDAIRKKAQQSLSHSHSIKENNIESKSKNKNFAAKTSVCITSNRLTLLRNAVSSDIISRKMICEEKNKKKLEKKVSDNSNFLANIVQPLKERITVVSANSSNQSVSHVSDEDEHTQSKVIRDTGEGRTPNSIILFSTLDRNEESDTSQNLQINTHGSDDRLSDTSSINDLYSQNSLYYNFMNEIPKYLQEKAPELLKTDFLSEYTKSLRDLCIVEGNLTNEGSSPLHYDFTLNYSDHESTFRNQLDAMSYSCQTVSHSELSSSPSVSMASCSTIKKSSSPLSFINSDSPEYNYYPHKLNN